MQLGEKLIVRIIFFTALVIMSIRVLISILNGEFLFGAQILLLVLLTDFHSHFALETLDCMAESVLV